MRVVVFAVILVSLLLLLFFFSWCVFLLLPAPNIMGTISSTTAALLFIGLYYYTLDLPDLPLPP